MWHLIDLQRTWCPIISTQHSWIMLWIRYWQYKEFCRGHIKVLFVYQACRLLYPAPTYTLTNSASVLTPQATLMQGLPWNHEIRTIPQPRVFVWVWEYRVCGQRCQNKTRVTTHSLCSTATLDLRRSCFLVLFLEVTLPLLFRGAYSRDPSQTGKACHCARLLTRTTLSYISFMWCGEQGVRRMQRG